MASSALLVAPLLVLAAVWFLLTAVDGDHENGRRQVAFGVGLLAAAVVLTAVGIVLDDQSPAPPRAPGGTAAAV